MQQLPRFFGILFLSFFLHFQSFAQTTTNSRLLKGMYIQWGYNTEWFTKSNIRFNLSNGDNFTLHNVKAHDKPDMDAIIKKPLEISIPQYNYRIGFYLNEAHTKSLELNFDHIKYVVTDYQKAYVTGTIDGKPVAGDSILDPATFLHFEHTDGGNLLHLNYVQQNTLLRTKTSKRPLINTIWKAGGGINIPRTDFTYQGKQLNNAFHIAGYNFAAEAGFRYYPFSHWFFEGTAKTGYARYVNALANTVELKGNRAHHGIGYFELIALVGYDIKF